MRFELTVASRDRAATDRLFTAGLGLAGDGEGRYLLGELAVRVEQVGAAEPAGPRELIARVADPDGLAERLRAGGYPPASDGLVELAGIRLRLASSAEDGSLRASSVVAADQNVLGLDHLGVATDSTVALTNALVEPLGFEQESRQIDTQLEQPLEVFSSDRYGVVSHAGTPRPAGALLVTFLRRGGVDIELLEDIMTEREVPATGPGSTTGDNRAISRFVRRRGAGLHHVAVRVRSMDAGLDRLRDAGVPLIDERGRPGSRRALIAFADRRGTGGLVAHLVERP